MNRKIIIIIEGYLASGKSTFAEILSKAINVPHLTKDKFKTAVCSSVSITNREESSRFSAIIFDAIGYVVERLMEAGFPIIIEGNFAHGKIKKVDEAGVLKSIIDKYGYDALTFKFTGDTKVLFKRFIEREKKPERGQANKMLAEISYHDFETWCHNLDGFDVGGKVINVDTTEFDKVDFEMLIETANSFIRKIC